MLFFAIFTLGYFFGVFITLYIFGRKGKVEESSAVESAVISGSNKAMSSWEIFTQLTKINYPKIPRGLVSGTSTNEGLMDAQEVKERENQAYATS